MISRLANSTLMLLKRGDCAYNFSRLTIRTKRWCASAGLDNVITLSDHRDLSFGENYGVVMEELRLLARAVFVLDADNKVVYKEIVSEGTDFPDFDAALAAYKKYLIIKEINLKMYTSCPSLSTALK